MELTVVYAGETMGGFKGVGIYNFRDYDKG